MAFFVILAIWFCAGVAVLFAHKRQQTSPQPFEWVGMLLGRWPEGTPDPGALAVVFLGRVWFYLLGLSLLRMLMGATWLEPCSSLLTLSILIALLALRSRNGDGMVFAGLTSIRTILRLPDKFRVFLGRVSAEGPLSGVSLSALDLRKHGFLVLAVGRSGRFIQFPKGSEVLMTDDLLLMYGRREA